MVKTATYRFTALIEHEASKGGAWVTVPLEVKALFGSLRPKVKVCFDGKVDYRGSLVRMGGEKHILGIRKDIRRALGKKPGDSVAVEVQLDTGPRRVEIPDSLQEAFRKHPEALEHFRSLSYTHQREYAEYILSAKKEETRQRRTQRTLQMLTEARGS